jgi:hypothetical protein
MRVNTYQEKPRQVRTLSKFPQSPQKTIKPDVRIIVLVIGTPPNRVQLVYCRRRRKHSCPQRVLRAMKVINTAAPMRMTNSIGTLSCSNKTINIATVIPAYSWNKGLFSAWLSIHVSFKYPIKAIMLTIDEAFLILRMDFTTGGAYNTAVFTHIPFSGGVWSEYYAGPSSLWTKSDIYYPLVNSACFGIVTV